MELSEIQVGAEIALAQRDIEARLNALEQRISRSVLSMGLENIDITTVIDESRRCVRTVRIAVLPMPGRIGVRHGA